MVGLRVFEKNLPDVYRAIIVSDRNDSAKTIIEGLERSISRSETTLLFSYWIPSVHRFADSFKFSDEELAQVILLLYNYIKESDLSLDNLQVTLSLLNRALRYKRNLQLDLD